MSYQESLDALSDPTRRAVLEALRQGPLPVGELAEGLPVSRPAVSQHLRVLERAGLVRATRKGTRRIYQVDPSGLLALREWVEGFWDDVLESFKNAAEERTP
jgi:DNA-binding transcriptional ArsR family regulator